MSFAVDSEDTFHLEPHSLSSDLRFNPDPAGGITIAIASGVRDVRVERKTALALLDWLKRSLRQT